MNTSDGSLFAAEDDAAAIDAAQVTPWKLLIVDDEPEVHAVTHLAISDFLFDGKPLSCVSAYSGAQARELLRKHSDFAVVLLDVVMETEHEGLDIVRFIRQELGNSLIRIILRTGNPGQAPPLKVIAEYDINDYKEKSELTADKLISAIYTSLRSYHDLQAIEQNRDGLETIIDTSVELFSTRSLETLFPSVLTQLAKLLSLGTGSSLGSHATGLVAHFTAEQFNLLATLEQADGKQAPATTQIPALIQTRLEQAVAQKAHVFGDNHFTGYLNFANTGEQLFYISGTQTIGQIDPSLITLFMRNVAVACETLYLNEEVERSQQELVHVLSEAIEKRSQETGNHVRRVAEYCRLLAKAAGLGQEDVDLLAQAAPLHDAGKIGIPDNILNKPGRHNTQEREVMRTHASAGYDILKRYERPVLKAAAIVAEQHHEHWDGNGYPTGLAGEDIHIFGRITAIADVFDALASDRVYKPAWPQEKIIQYLKDQTGKQFDPKLVPLFLAQLPELDQVRARFADSV